MSAGVGKLAAKMDLIIGQTRTYVSTVTVEKIIAVAISDWTITAMSARRITRQRDRKSQASYFIRDTPTA